MQKHTVEKIGGTSMTRFGDVMNNVIKGKRSGEEFYHRIFVVSAYGGITNLLLEDKKTGAPGVYGYFAKGNAKWADALEKTRLKMLELNRTFTDIGLDIEQADEFVNERIAGIKACLEDLMRLRSYGHFKTEDYLPASRELLSAIGEAHSAFNSSLILQANGVNAVFADLTGWKDTQIHSLNEMIVKCFEDIDYSKQLPIATGYVKCSEGLMNRFDRGYSEITFSKIAVLTDACEGIIHKEFHLSTGDPRLIGAEKVEIIGNTNFDIADQLADMDMEAIHSKASKEMELKYIPIRVKNAFDPEHPGTLISHDYVSPEPRVEMICGRNDIVAIEVMDAEMVGESGYDYKLLESFNNHKVSYIAKNTNANTITHYVPEKARNLKECLADLKQTFPNSSLRTTPIAIVSVIGTNMKIPGFLSKAAQALADANINILALDQCMRQVTMQFMVGRADFEKAQIALHNAFVENK
ncbi:aspartate kinase [Lentisphaerota bacterium WC36G]|nr:aspartate kinase [Lentisphaerae bacterium WC36]